MGVDVGASVSEHVSIACYRFFLFAPDISFSSPVEPVNSDLCIVFPDHDKMAYPQYWALLDGGVAPTDLRFTTS